MTYRTCHSTGGRQDHAETQVDVRPGRDVPEAIGRAQRPGVIEPTDGDRSEACGSKTETPLGGIDLAICLISARLGSAGAGDAVSQCSVREA